MRRPSVRRAAALTALVLGLAGSGALAAETSKPAVDRVDVNKVGLPIVWRGRVVNYVFVATRIYLAPGTDGQALRAKEPYFRDALVRAGHHTPFTEPSDLSHVDERAVDAALLREARRIAGPAVTRVEVIKQQPRRRLPRPGPDAPQGRPITP